VLNSSLTSVGTINSGTWNGSSISTTYTDAKVTVVNGRIGAVTGLAETANSLSQFASTTSLQLATLISDETGTGNVVFSTSPILTTPNLGTPSAATLTNATGLPIGSGVSGLGANVATFLADPTSAKLAFTVSDETGSGNLVFSTSPILVTPNLGTPSAVTLTNATGLPVGTGISGLGANQTTKLAANAWSGVTAATYGGTSFVPVLTVDVYGRVTSVSNVSITGGVSSVGGASGAVSNAQLASSITSSGVLTTANVSELTNLYYTDTRARNSLSAGSGINYSSSTGVISSTVTQNNYNDASARSSVSITGSKGSYNSGTGVFSFANIANVTVSANVPGSPNIGDIWFDNATGSEYLYFDDGTSTQWVEQGASTYVTVSSGSAVTSVAGSSGVISNAMIASALTGLAVSHSTVAITGTTISTSSATGALIVSGGVGVTGNIYASGDIISPNFYSQSDLALKQNVVPIKNPLEKLMGISGVNFKWKNNKAKAVGIIAQDVEKVLPEAVSTDGQGYKVVSYDSLIPLLIESVKSLKAELDLLKNKKS